ncbi:helix-hairpin-helix domain-containing protein [Marinomonas algicola]|uniref:helix-hairpin-helix domain-containing protein n=1 Tax=Marinomonas algicola TaxID=2773454 RepID=UPI003B847E4B
MKLERLAKIKGTPLAVAERLVAQRPFHSIKAILSVKGVEPKTLHNIFDALNN